MAVSAKRIWISEFEGTSPTADNAKAGDIILRPERDGVFAEVRGSLAAVLEGADGLTNGAGSPFPSLSKPCRIRVGWLSRRRGAS